MQPLIELVRDAFHRPSTRAYRWTQGFVWVLIVVSVALVVLELTVPGAWSEQPVLAWVDGLILAVFALELTLRVATYQPPELDFFADRTARRLFLHLWGRLRFLMKPLNLVDLFTVMALVPALRGLRALRLLRLLRTGKVFRYSNPFEGLMRAFQENRILFIFGQSLLGFATLIGGLSIFLVERRDNPELQTLQDGFWWAIVTLTTVGFGDIAPVTGLGRIIGAVLMVAGMFLLALFAGLVGHTLLHAVLGIREEQFRMSSYIGHVVIMGYDPGAAMLLDAIEQEQPEGRGEIVLVANRERPKGVPPRFTWVQGDPTKESELDKVRLTHADKVVVIGSRSDSPQHADAVTLLTLFTLRRFLDQQEATARRKQPLYVVAEILDQENVEHARTAGADEVIETHRLGFSLIAHAISQPGTGTVMSEVAAAGAHSLYVSPWEAGADQPQPRTFGDYQRAIKHETGALVIGVRTGAGEDRINPPEDAQIPAGTMFLYLAEGPIQPREPDES